MTHKTMKMRVCLTLLLNLTLAASLHSQTLTERIALNACEQLSAIDDYQTLEDSIQPSIIAAVGNVMINATPEEKEIMNTVSGIKGLYEDIYSILPSYCNNVMRLFLANRKSEFYKNSENQLANQHFEQGNALMKAGDYKKAIKKFKSAVKLDNSFIYAIDHIAVSYRRQDKYKPAIKYYKKSLEIFPEGDVALLNIAVAYSLTKNYQKSIDNYKKLRFLYPDSPEGYFGLARMQFIMEDYENALDNLFIAYHIYLDTESDYVDDSKRLLTIMYDKMKELNKIDLLLKKAEEYNFTIEG